MCQAQRGHSASMKFDRINKQTTVGADSISAHKANDPHDFKIQRQKRKTTLLLL